MRNAITVDVEEYFHPSEVCQSADFAAWEKFPSRVEMATGRALELLARHGVQATFFVLGWVARRHPGVVRQIARAGHEIGCHGYAHQLVYDLTPREFREDTERAQAAIADACGQLPRVYRAASYSITSRSWWALEILVECGFTHDSSIYPIRHDRYGMPGFGVESRRIETPAGDIFEAPIATARLSDRSAAPVGGGAYLRLLPYQYTAAGLRRINQQERRPACVYFHPWELDPEQPRLTNGLLSRIRTYAGLRTMEAKLDRLLREFQFTTLTAAYPACSPRPAPTEVVAT